MNFHIAWTWTLSGLLIRSRCIKQANSICGYLFSKKTFCKNIQDFYRVASIIFSLWVGDDKRLNVAAHRLEGASGPSNLVGKCAKLTTQNPGVAGGGWVYTWRGES